MVQIAVKSHRATDMRYLSGSEIAQFDPTPGDFTLTVSDQELLLSDVANSYDVYFDVGRIVAEANRLICAASYGNEKIILEDYFPFPLRRRDIQIQYANAEVDKLAFRIMSEPKIRKEFINSLYNGPLHPSTAHFFEQLALSSSGAKRGGEILSTVVPPGLALLILSDIGNEAAAARLLNWMEYFSGGDYLYALAPFYAERPDEFDLIAQLTTQSGIYIGGGQLSPGEVVRTRDKILHYVAHFLKMAPERENFERFKDRIFSLERVDRAYSRVEWSPAKGLTHFEIYLKKTPKEVAWENFGDILATFEVAVRRGMDPNSIQAVLELLELYADSRGIEFGGQRIQRLKKRWMLQSIEPNFVGAGIAAFNGNPFGVDQALEWARICAEESNSYFDGLRADNIRKIGWMFGAEASFQKAEEAVEKDHSSSSVLSALDDARNFADRAGIPFDEERARSIFLDSIGPPTIEDAPRLEDGLLFQEDF